MRYYVYILYNRKHDKFYIGQTYNLDKRTLEHALGLSNYTSKYDGRWELAYNEELSTRKEAMSREKILKRQKNKQFYKKLCNIS
jgi:putative endonuclease